MDAEENKKLLDRLARIEGQVRGLRKMLEELRLMRTWGGIMDMTMDGSPIIGKLPVRGLYMTGGWCYGGFKATPASGFLHAHTIAHDDPHPLNAAFNLERFAAGRLIDEKGAGPYAWAH